MTIKLDIKQSDQALDATAVAQLAAGLAPVAMDAAQRSRLRAEVLQSVARSERGAQVVKVADGRWITIDAGVEIKALRVDHAARTQTSLWRMAAGATLIEHDHDAEEECLVVAGAVQWAGDHYGEGDYLLVPAGFHHSEIRSAEGATLLIRGELRDSMLPALSASLS